MSRPDGGPAFPSTAHKPCPCGIQMEVTGHHGGMSLRDYFAAASAMGQRMIDRPISSEDVANLAYQDAAAMLKERERNA